MASAATRERRQMGTASSGSGRRCLAAGQAARGPASETTQPDTTLEHESERDVRKPSGRNTRRAWRQIKPVIEAVANTGLSTTIITHTTEVQQAYRFASMRAGLPTQEEPVALCRFRHKHLTFPHTPPTFGTDIVTLWTISTGYERHGHLCKLVCESPGHSDSISTK